MSDTDRSVAASGFWSGRRVLVTGATGFLGSHVTAALVDAGADVVVLARDAVPPSPIASGWLDHVTTIRGDVVDQGLVERVLGEYDVRTVLHLAAQSQVGVANRNPASTFDANVRGTWAVLEAARRSPLVEQVVLASSDKAYGNQPTLPYTEDMPLLAVNPYDVSKACADLIGQSYHATYGLPVTITRCGNFFGPGDRNWERIIPGTARSVLRGERPVLRSDGTMIRDYLYVVDGARAYLRLAEAMADRPELAGEVFNFSTGEPKSVLEVVELVQRAAGTHLEPDIQDRATAEIPEQHLSADKARRVLGWEPSATLEEAMAETVAWYRADLGL
ncbi:MAG TPA: NAD-dependent epimerase/dehydratase family protein [Acidimicrobiales bacterium]|nr:NAD-dependent epimerase/dehydratase family protein [Acidimicrobiales bacterium]